MQHNENIGYLPLEIVSKVCIQATGSDIFMSLQAKTHIARPKWSELFGSLKSGDARAAARETSLFFCGPTTLGQSIVQQCQNIN